MKIKRKVYATKYDDEDDNEMNVYFFEYYWHRLKAHFRWRYWKFLKFLNFLKGPYFYKTQMKICWWEIWKWKKEAKIISKDNHTMWEELLKKTMKVKELNDKVIALKKELMKLNESQK